MSQRGHKWQISGTMCPDSWDPDLVSTVIAFLVSSPQVPNQRRLCLPAHECSEQKILREDCTKHRFFRRNNFKEWPRTHPIT